MDLLFHFSMKNQKLNRNVINVSCDKQKKKLFFARTFNIICSLNEYGSYFWNFSRNRSRNHSHIRSKLSKNT